jgi:hypothetical protein
LILRYLVEYDGVSIGEEKLDFHSRDVIENKWCKNVRFWALHDLDVNKDTYSRLSMMLMIQKHLAEGANRSPGRSVAFCRLDCAIPRILCQRPDAFAAREQGLAKM